MNMRSRKYLAGAKDQSCVNCGANDGTVVAAHYQGLRSNLLGKGRGIKPHDLCVADLCRTCHESFDTSTAPVDVGMMSPFAQKIDRSEQFLFLIVKTLLRRLEQGIITIDDLKGIAL
jgi:hypothetical protein